MNFTQPPTNTYLPTTTMVHFNISRPRSSTSSSCALHELAPSLLGSTEGMNEESSKQNAGRRLSKIRTKISSTISKSSLSPSASQPSNHPQTLPSSRPRVRRTISRSMIAPLQHLFSGDHHTSEFVIPERYEGNTLSPGLVKSYSALFCRRTTTPSLYHHKTCDDEDWDFRCQGMAPIIPARPSEDALSPASAYDHSLLASPGLFHDGSFGTSSASSCCSSPTSYNPPLCSFSSDNIVKKQKICIDSISGPLNLWTTPPSLLLAPPSHESENQLLGLDMHT